MNNRTVKNSVFGLTALAAVIFAAVNFSIGMCMAAVLPLAILGVYLLRNKNKTFYQSLDWYFLAWVLLYLGMARSGLPERNLPALLKPLERLLEEILNDGQLSVVLLILAALQLFFRKKKSPFLTAVRYLGAGLAMQGVVLKAYWMVGAGNMETFLPMVLCAVFFFRELREKAAQEETPRLGRYVLFACLYTVYVSVQGGAAIVRMEGLAQSGWLLLVVAVTGVLLIVIDADTIHLHGRKAPEGFAQGVVFLAWCLLGLLNILWPTTANPAVLLLGMPIAHYAYAVYFRRAQEDDPGIDPYKNLLTAMGLILVGLLLAGKSVNTCWYCLAIALVLLLLSWVCWMACRKGSGKALAMRCFWGVAAGVLLASTKQEFFNRGWERILPGVAGSVIFLSILWCAACVTVNRISKDSAQVYEEEYDKLKAVQTWLPAAMGILAAARILFVF